MATRPRPASNRVHAKHEEPAVLRPWEGAAVLHATIEKAAEGRRAAEKRHAGYHEGPRTWLIEHDARARQAWPEGDDRTGS